MSLSIAVLFVAASSVGCGESVDPEVSALRKKFFLEETPGDEKAVATIRKELMEPEAGSTADVVIRCRIDAGDFSPWVEGKAMFLATDATGHDGSEADHNPHECPFCSRDINSYMAQVEFHDDDGNTIPIAAEKLFDVKKRQLVVVRGTGSINEQDLLVVRASGIHIIR